MNTILLTLRSFNHNVRRL